VKKGGYYVEIIKEIEIGKLNSCFLYIRTFNSEMPTPGQSVLAHPSISPIKLSIIAGD